MAKTNTRTLNSLSNNTTTELFAKNVGYLLKSAFSSKYPANAVDYFLEWRYREVTEEDHKRYAEEIKAGNREKDDIPEREENDEYLALVAADFTVTEIITRWNAKRKVSVTVKTLCEIAESLLPFVKLLKEIEREIIPSEVSASGKITVNVNAMMNVKE